MSVLLAIETATKMCSVALFREGKLIDSKEENGSYSHAEHLAVFARDLLAKNELSFADLTSIAVSKGPGSYTGLRIGVSFAKGLCYSLQIPLIAVETLKSMAQMAVEKIEEEAHVCAMIDARRSEVYSAVYSKELLCVEPIQAKVIDNSSYTELLQTKKLYFIGDGAEKCNELIKHNNACFELEVYPSAKGVGKLAHEKYVKKEFEDVAYFEPFYLKEFVATKGKKLV